MEGNCWASENSEWVVAPEEEGGGGGGGGPE
jgi:hypothetical protein